MKHVHNIVYTPNTCKHYNLIHVNVIHLIHVNIIHLIYVNIIHLIHVNIIHLLHVNIIHLLLYYTYFRASVNHYISINIYETLLTLLNRDVL